MIFQQEKYKDIHSLRDFPAFISKAFFPDENPYEKPVNRTAFALFILLYVLICLLQVTEVFSAIYRGISSQFHVLIAIYVTMRFGRIGYYSILFLSFLSLVLVCDLVFIQGVSSAVTGIMVYVFSIISINIIRWLVNQNSRQFKKVIAQTAEITALYEEIAASEEELREQNEQLTEYNRIIKNNEANLSYLAHFDLLTQLPNRKMIMDELEKIIRQSRTAQQTFAVVFIDLDNFKKINDTLGHHIGDLLIQAVSTRLRSVMLSSDILGRLGGDEFALIIRRSISEQDILSYIEHLRQTVENPFFIERADITITASFGIAVYPQDGNDPGELIKCADTAMYQAKDAGKNNSRFFRKEMLDTILAKIEFEDMLASAVKNQELRLVFQPQYHTDGQTIRGFETLIRWQSPTLGQISPANFIPVAEENGQIIAIGEWVLRNAINTFCQIQDEYKLNSILSVNISAVQIEEPTFIPMVKALLSETGFDAKQLEFEITETAFIKSMKQTIKVLHEFKALGIKIALDDFGTGYSSLSYLQMLPIDTLKIDKSFIDGINTQNEAKQIVGSIIDLVHKLDMEVIVEGVETELQLRSLINQGCDYIQGFFLSKPLERKAFEDLVKRHSA
jgi:diguanylate cyclase (GGDEF)-like protein